MRDVRDVTLLGSKGGNTSSSESRGGAPQRQRPAKAADETPSDFADDDIPF